MLEQVHGAPQSAAPRANASADVYGFNPRRLALDEQVVAASERDELSVWDGGRDDAALIAGHDHVVTGMQNERQRLHER